MHIVQNDQLFKFIICLLCKNYYELKVGMKLSRVEHTLIL